MINKSIVKILIGNIDYEKVKGPLSLEEKVVKLSGLVTDLSMQILTEVVI